MSAFAAAGFTVFILILFVGIFLNLFGLPGTIVIFFDVLLYAIFTGFDPVGLKIILFLLISTVIAETIDFFGYVWRYTADDIKKIFWGCRNRSCYGSIFAYTVFWGTGHLGRIFFRRSCRNIDNRIYSPIKIKGSFPNAPIALFLL